jgi:hypothetical protein
MALGLAKAGPRAFVSHGERVLERSDVLGNMEGVLESIVGTLNPDPPHSSPLPSEKRVRVRASGEVE